MNISSVEELPFSALASDYNLVIAASGYESRARFVAEALGFSVPGAIRIALAFAEHSGACARPQNDEKFRELGYALVICHGGVDNEVILSLASAFDRFKDNTTIKILIDISSMTRSWYGAVVRCLGSFDCNATLIVHFTYTPACFVAPPSEYPPNRVVSPVVGFTGNTLPDKPTALLLGLGYDKDRAIGLKDHLDPQLTVLFYADPASDPRYVPHVLSVNRDLIEEVGEDCVFKYSFTDCASTFRFIESITGGLSHEWRVVLCSLGPKIFGLCCFLVASIQRDISIWRVSADSHEIPFDHKPCGTPTLLQTTWHRFGR